MDHLEWIQQKHWSCITPRPVFKVSVCGHPTIRITEHPRVPAVVTEPEKQPCFLSSSETPAFLYFPKFVKKQRYRLCCLCKMFTVWAAFAVVLCVIQQFKIQNVSILPRTARQVSVGGDASSYTLVRETN